jgi:hypothetical protein
MVSISRSVLLTASLLAFPLAGAMAQHDPSRESTGPGSATAGANKMGDPKESTGPGSATAGANKMGDPKDDGSAMKSTAPGYQDKSDVSGGVGKSPGNAAATGQQEKK